MHSPHCVPQHSHPGEPDAPADSCMSPPAPAGLVSAPVSFLPLPPSSLCFAHVLHVQDLLADLAGSRGESAAAAAPDSVAATQKVVEALQVGIACMEEGCRRGVHHTDT